MQSEKRQRRFQTFVTEQNGIWQCTYKNCTIAQDARKRSFPAQSSSSEHIAIAQEVEKHENDGPEPLPLQDPKALPAPPSIISELEQLHSSSTPIIQRVPDESFVISDKQQTQERPLGIFMFALRRLHPSLVPRPISFTALAMLSKGF